MTCYKSIINSITALAFIQVASNVIEIIRHCIMHFCASKIKYNTLGFIIIKLVITMVIFFLVGVGLYYLSKDDTEVK
ncbi:MPPV-255 putative IMV membrane protein [Magpiepox virus 2]|nr:putative IMV membrane protein [Magpiepox virus]QZW33577.1 MPPV-255 putative IMV membrane protein [Magpiepox virus 2]